MTEAKYNLESDLNKNQEENDEDHEIEIPPITHRFVNPQKPKPRLPKPIAEFFIADLFRAQLIGKTFTFKGLTFRTVKLRGMIVGVDRRTRPVVTVDDGTGRLDCFLEQNPNLPLIKETVQRLEKSFINPNIKEVSVLQRGIQLMIRATQKNLKEIPEPNDLRLGDEIELIGNLSEYNNRRNIFVNHIVKKSELNAFEDDARHMMQLLALYENVYARN